MFGQPLTSEQVERAKMQAEELSHSVYRLVMEAPTDHLLTLRALFHEGLGPEAGEYLCGLINAQLRWVRRECDVCGNKSHEGLEC